MLREKNENGRGKEENKVVGVKVSKGIWRAFWKKMEGEGGRRLKV